MLIVGLGNPGKEYSSTRHNLGFVVADALCSELSSGFSEKDKFYAFIALAEFHGNKLILAKPTTFMNLSGRSVQSILSFYKQSTETLIVIHDEIDLVFGKIKTKLGGGSAGHNGLKSIDQLLGNNYWRVRIGVGRPTYGAVSDYVLGNFTKEEQENIPKIVADAKTEIFRVITEINNKKIL